MPGLLAQDIVGKDASRRDISDIITMVDMHNTPFTSMCPKASQTEPNLLFEWPLDNEETPGDNAQIEGSDVSSFDNAFQNYGLAKNRMQWFRRAAMVGTLAENTQNFVGVKQKLAKSLAKKMTQIKRDMEIRFCGDTELQEGTGAVPNKTRGIGTWLQSSAQAIYPVPSAFRTPSGAIDTTATASAEDSTYQNVLGAIWDQSGKDGTFTYLCGRTEYGVFKNLQQVSSGSTNTMQAIRTYTAEQDDKKIVNTVNIYEGDSGTLQLVKSKWLGYANDGSSVAATSACRGYVLNMDMWEIRNSIMPRQRPLPDLGGGPRFLVEAVAGLVCWSPLAQGKRAPTS